MPNEPSEGTTRRALLKGVMATTVAVSFPVAPATMGQGVVYQAAGAVSAGAMEDFAMASLLMSLLDIDRASFDALSEAERVRLRDTLYAVLGSTIVGGQPGDEPANEAIGHFLAAALMIPPEGRSATTQARITALEERLRPSLELVRRLDCVPEAPAPPPRSRY